MGDTKFQAPVVRPTFTAGTCAPAASAGATWTGPVGLVYIQNESGGAIRVQFGSATYDTAHATNAIIGNGQTRSFQIIMSALAVHVPAAHPAGVQFEPSAPAAHDVDVVIWGTPTE